MNAVVALCHFCEQHGPSIMFCSEKGGMPAQPEAKLEMLPELSSSQDIPLGTSYPGSVVSADLSRPCSRAGSTKRSLCQACKSLSDGHKGYISYDSDAGEVYVSSQHPQNQNVFSKVRQACVRSLSCEVCPGREGPIFYGDENDGYVLSYTFFVKDSLARGFKRWYSVIVVMMDRIYLIQSWPFLVECIGKIIAYLQKCACSVYNVEWSACPQRAMRIKGTYSKTVTPENFRSNRSSNSNARALIELTGEKRLYSYLHASFTWMMRACKLRWKEHIVCVPPTLDELSLSDKGINDEDAIPDYDTRLSFTSLRHMREALQPPLFRAVVWHLLIGNQVVWHGEQGLVSSAVRVLSEIIPKNCANIVEWTESFAKDATLIGLSIHTPLPKFRHKEYICIEAQVKNSFHVGSPQRLDSNTIDFRMNSGCIIPEKGPSMLGKLEAALANENLSDEVVKQCLACQKQEWINKTRVLHKFVIDKRNKEDTNELLYNCLGCNDDDVKLMRFWMRSVVK